MQKVSIVAKNYAKALFELANKADNIDLVEKDFGVFSDNFTTEFGVELKNPAISKKDCCDIAKKICDKLAIKSVVAEFIEVIFKNKRVEILAEIYLEFTRLVKLKNNILEVELFSVEKLDESFVDDIKQVISKKYSDKKIEIIESFKDQILGGFQIKIGSNLIDASLRNQIENLRKEIVLAIN